MKKTYMAPAVEINETMACQSQMMLVASIQDGSADSSDALVKKESDWDMWGDDED